MISLCIETFIVFISEMLHRLRRRRAPKAVAATTTAAAGTVCLGKIIRSQFQPPLGEGEPTELWLTAEERRRHIYLLGRTGAGKTNLLIQLIRADIEQGRAVFLLDFRGELVDRVLMYLAATFSPDELEKRLVLIDFRRLDYSVPFNPLKEDAADVYTRVRFILEVIRQLFELGVQTEQLLRYSLLALCDRYSLYELEPFLTNAAFRASVLAGVKDASVRRFFARFDNMANQSAWVEPVLNKCSNWLYRPVLRNSLTRLDTISFHRLLDKRPDCIVLVSLAGDTLFSDAIQMGSMITSALISAAMRPERRDKKGNEVSLYCDEFEHFDGLSEQMSAILSEGRKFGLCACLSHQTSIQLNPKLRNLIRNVVGTQAIFSIGAEADELAAGIVSDEPKALVKNALMGSKVGECVVVQTGQPSYRRVRTKHCPDPDIEPDKVEALRLSALRAFGMPQAEIEADLATRDAAFETFSIKSQAATAQRKRKGPNPTSSIDTILEVRDADDRP